MSNFKGVMHGGIVACYVELLTSVSVQSICQELKRNPVPLDLGMSFISGAIVKQQDFIYA